ncbi:hypothetical protein [Paraburkholderia tropica]|uniref:Uncharacterized protein n=1 Tax=Paraburkholderia tropica TaxID=92647 RepID=A0A1A5X9J3_9BURK|nr:MULTISPECIES: hypothetical protein [Paraburkholderia]MBB2978621.1 hypothetical protein [Paraburkholderia tropica]OBR49743.1 hypothetical protein A6456_28185 [Paraburkholderia tropica]SEI85750.1 hypothetical protein SAMN05216550_101195 [Paraburkholderia tropica]
MSLKDLFGGKSAASAASAAPPTPPPAAASPSSSASSPEAGATSGADNAGATAASQSATGTANGGAATAGPSTAPATPASPPASPLAGFTAQMQGGAAAAPATDALNSQIVQAVQLTNAETTAYASSQIAAGPNMMISQASGLVAQSAANYFDGASKLALASKSVLLKNMTEKLLQEDIKGAAEDALGVLITDLLVGTAAAVAAAAGAIEGESAHFALEKIDQSINKYQSLLDRKGG